MEHLILKYLKKNLTEADEYKLKEWLKKDKRNRKIFENIVADWSLETSDIEKSKRRVYRNVVGTPDVRPKNNDLFSYFVKIAAVLVVVLIATFLFVKKDEQRLNDKAENSLAKIEERHALPGQKLKMKLPDGTQIVLNSDSRLVTAESFGDSVRKVFLEGEAFFEVAEDASKPFIIETNVANVVVLGTSFNVRSYLDEEDLSVAVSKGKVSVSDKNISNEHLLLKNEMLVYSIKEKSFNKQVDFDKELIFGWKDQYLGFEDESFDQILKQLSRWYNVEFKVLRKIDQEKKFTAGFKNQSLETVMQSMSFNYEFEYEINEKEVVIK